MGEHVKFLLVVLFLLSCKDHGFRKGRFFAGELYASRETLNTGKVIYTEYCMPCHGVKGDGKGPSSKGLTVPPRDFTQGIYKFGRVESGTLPTDEDFHRIIKKGLKGTAMIPWDMSKNQIHAVVQYIKTFAPSVWEGKDKKIGTPVLPTKDPYGLARRQSALKRGEEVYHVIGECQTCHQGYLSEEKFKKMYFKVNRSHPDLDDSFYQVKQQESEYGVVTIPPDFTWHEVRSAGTVEDLYVRISAGVGGTSMPGWRDTLEDGDIWAVAYYVKSLMDKREKKEKNP